MKRRTGIPRDVAQGQSASRRSREHEKRMNIHGGKGVATLVSFYASLRAGNNHREVISILLGGVFAMREKTTAKKNSRCLRRTSASGNKFLSLRSLSLSLSLSWLSFIAWQGYPIPILPIFYTLSPVKFPLLKLVDSVCGSFRAPFLLLNVAGRPSRANLRQPSSRHESLSAFLSTTGACGVSLRPKLAKL